MQVTASVDIDRPPDQVFEYLADMSNNPNWQKGQESCVLTSDPPVQIGSTFDQVARFFRRTVTSSFEVIEFDPGRRIRVKTTGGLASPIDVTRTVEPRSTGPNGEGSGSTVSAIVRGDAAGVFGVAANIAAPVLRILVRNSVRQDYRRLKALLEATSPT